jgi:hypothetical protein
MIKVFLFPLSGQAEKKWEKSGKFLALEKKFNGYQLVINLSNFFGRREIALFPGAYKMGHEIISLLCPDMLNLSQSCMASPPY